MNKKLLTAAIGAALVAGPMLAQADVKLYGKVHVSVDKVDDLGSGVARPTHTAVTSNASRWGIDVSEKLGGGMTAIAKLETEIDASGETSSQNTRNRYAGLKGKFGQVLGGIYDTPFKEISRTLELFPEYVGDTRNLVSTGGTGANTGQGWDLRTSSSVRYDSPSLNGFVVNYLHSADSTSSTVAATDTVAATTSSADDNRRRVDSIGVKYAKGPLYVAYSRESHRFSTITGSGEESETGNRVGASYNFGAFKLVGMYQDLDDLGGTSAGGTSVQRKGWVLGGAFTAGNNVFKLQYVKADKLNNT